MSYVKRYIENEVDRIAKKSGYAWDFIMDIAMESLEADGEIDWKHIELVSMEHDW